MGVSKMFGGGGGSQPMFIPPPPPPPAANPPTFANANVQGAGRETGVTPRGRGAGFAGTDLSSGAGAVTSAPTAKMKLGQ